MPKLINGFIVISLLITAAFLVGLFTYLTDHEKNHCEMTYMFEYPQYVRISTDFDEIHPRYSLYAYSEGHMTSRTRDMYFDGMPVLFLPGNGGSYRQVRSLASVALRKAFSNRFLFHFDYFTIDFNEELSGLCGAVLNDQLAYANQSIFRILDLYKNRGNPPRSIVLLGHSMGGVLARNLVGMFDSELIPIVVTMATPHKRFPLMLDHYMYDFYGNYQNRYISRNTTFVSLSGGYNDFLITYPLTEFTGKNNLNVVTTHIPLAWISTDHTCILWCKQIILALNRALFDSVDVKLKQISSDPEIRKNAFHHHLIHNSGTKRKYDQSKLEIRTNGDWMEYLARQFSVNLKNGTKTPKFYMVKLIDNFKHEFLSVIGLNVQTIDWIFVCSATIPKGNNRVCDEAINLTPQSEIAPSVRYKRRKIELNLHQLMATNKNFTHVVIRILPTDEPVTLHFDIYNKNERKMLVNLPNLWKLNGNVIVNETNENVINLELELPQLQHLIQSFKLDLSILKCLNHFSHATASLIVPWGYQNQHKYFTETDRKPFHIRLYNSRPLSSSESAKIVLNLDPTCQYRISIKPWIFGQLGQMARFYTPLLIVNCGVVLLMILRAQLINLNDKKECLIFFDAVKDGAKPYYLLTVVKLLTRFMNIGVIQKFVELKTMPDWLILSKDGLDFFLLPLLLYICSVGIVWILGVVLCVCLTVFETTIHKLMLKFLARTVSFTITWSDYLMSALHKLPFLVAGILISLSFTCGSLSLCLGMVFYFLKLTRLSQDFIEELVWTVVKKLMRKWKKNQENDEKKPGNEEKVGSPINNAINFHATIFLMWAMVTFINLPSILTWAHNFKFETVLKPDPSFVPGFVLSVCALPLWQLDLPKIERKWYKELGNSLLILAIASLLLAPISIFRLTFIITFVIVLVTVHQVFGMSRENIQISEGNLEGMYEKVKAKLE